MVTPGVVFERLDVEDRYEVASTCFREGRFDAGGEILCRHPRGYGEPECEKEFLCELMAAIILMPSERFGPTSCRSDGELAAMLQVEPWVVRFRRAIDEGQSSG